MNLAWITGEVGSNEEAVGLAEQALAIAEELGREEGGETAARLRWGAQLTTAGVIFTQAGKYDRAEAAYRQALAVADDLSRTQPSNPQVQLLQAAAHTSLASACQRA